MRQFIGEVRALVVDAGIEAQLLNHIAALVHTTRHADYPQAFDLRYLADHRTHGTGSCRDHQRLTGLGLPDVHQAHVGGHARHAQHTQGQ
ncbi:hypothetical protein D3C81_2130070 [compost metagenome]